MWSIARAGGAIIPQPFLHGVLGRCIGRRVAEFHVVGVGNLTELVAFEHRVRITAYVAYCSVLASDPLEVLLQHVRGLVLRPHKVNIEEAGTIAGETQ